MPPTAAVAEADEVAMAQEDAPCEEMSPFAHQAQGTVVDFGLPPTVLRATAAEPTAPPPPSAFRWSHLSGSEGGVPIQVERAREEP